MRKGDFTILVMVMALCALVFVEQLFNSAFAFVGQSNLRSRIIGRILERDTLNPLAAEVGITVRDAGNLFLRHVTASQSGLFEIGDLPAGDVHLTTKLDGYAPEHLTLSLNEGETRYVEFYLLKGKVVLGSVQDSAGDPVAGAKVTIAYAVEQTELMVASYQWERGEVITDATGRFEIRDVHPGKEFIVVASGAGFLPAVSSPVRINPGAMGVFVRLTLDRGVNVVGQIRDEDGKIVQGAEVTLLDVTRRPELLRFNSFELMEESNKHTVSDASGMFRFNQVRPLRKMLVVSHPGYQPFKQFVDITGRQSQLAIEVTLRSKR